MKLLIFNLFYDPMKFLFTDLKLARITQKLHNALYKYALKHQHPYNFMTVITVNILLQILRNSTRVSEEV